MARIDTIDTTDSTPTEAFPQTPTRFPLRATIVNDNTLQRQFDLSLTLSTSRDSFSPSEPLVGTFTVTFPEERTEQTVQPYLEIDADVRGQRYVHVHEGGSTESIASFPLQLRELGLPPQWSCESERKKVKVEVSTGGDWIELPTTEVELYENKANNVSVVRTARITSPREWAGENVRQYLRGFNSDRPQEFSFARIYFKDRSGEYWIKHFGFVGGVGPAGQDNTIKWYVYDLSRLLAGRAVGQSFDSATPNEILRQVAQLIVQTTPVPIIGSLTYDSGAGARVGPAIEDVDASETAINPPDNEFGSNIDTSSIDIELDDSPASNGPDIETTSDSILAVQEQEVGSKSFSTNRDTLLDVMAWLTKQTDGEWWLEPAPYGVFLRLDLLGGGFGRNFLQREAAERDDFENVDKFRGDYRLTNFVDVLENTTLYDLQPQNTVQVRGAASASAAGQDTESFNGNFNALASATVNREFPVVVATAPALVEAAGGVRLQPPVIESDAQTIDEAINVARTRLREILAESGEGNIVMRGAPRVTPYSKIDAFETCGEYVSELSQPIPYEVESVVHRQTEGGVYKVDAKVGIFVGGNDFRVERAEMVSMGGDN